MSNISKKPGIQLAVIPFSGFYNSVHGAELDDALNQMFSDGRGNPNENLVGRAFNLVNWVGAHTLYAEEYAVNFAAEFELPSMIFDDLNSPREYNFVTDRIFVNVSIEDVRSAFERVTPLTLTDKAEEMFTSRSGFISFYTPDWTSWGQVEEWDHNQLFCLFTALAEDHFGEEFDSWKECGLMENDRGNGVIDRILEEAMCVDHKEEVTRLWNISDYLRQREERRWEVAA